jgi:hypothetical protein
MQRAAKCSEKPALFDDYQRAIPLHAEALKKLQTKMRTTSRDENQVWYDAAEALRKNARTAEQAFEKHIAQHGC